MKYKVLNIGDKKFFHSKKYNFVFNKKTGFFVRWGEKLEKDAIFSPFGPEILDIELSTICNQGCSFCYKSNTSCGDNMSLETYKKILDKMPETLTQVAFGIGDWNGNPDLKKIVEYTWSRGIVPNITINGFGMSEEDIKWASQNFGAISVSNYDKNTCYNMIEKLTSYGLKQCNIHQLLSEETLNECFILLNDRLTDYRLKKLNAIVFLSLKPKGNRNKFHTVSDENRYKNMINFALDNNIPIGFDSCGASRFLNSIKENKNFSFVEKFIEPCESSLFSMYINVFGEYFPCSFCEGEKQWAKGIDIVGCKNILDVWNNKKTKEFRKNMLKCVDSNNCRKCIMYSV